MNGADKSAGRGGGRDINRDSDGKFHPYAKPPGINDLCCTHCGIILRNQVFVRRGSCPGCKRGIPLGSGWGFNGWGRCGKCFRFTERGFAFCQNCGVGNNETIANRLKQISDEVQYVKRMEHERVTALQMQNDAKDEEIRKLREIVAASEKVHFESLIQDDDEFVGDVMDLEVSSGISQTGVNASRSIEPSQQDGNVEGDASVVRSKDNEEDYKTGE
ncbi:unnamed protein product [Orchesella dallaii]|uniref:Uncharacterized protein n=1 Tax=Orchesella dallaii TaxID=48710 RepID=A0ABP1QJU4_9HEXA